MTLSTLPSERPKRSAGLCDDFLTVYFAVVYGLCLILAEGLQRRFRFFYDFVFHILRLFVFEGVTVPQCRYTKGVHPVSEGATGATRVLHCECHFIAPFLSALTLGEAFSVQITA